MALFSKPKKQEKAFIKQKQFVYHYLSPISTQPVKGKQKELGGENVACWG